MWNKNRDYLITGSDFLGRMCISLRTQSARGACRKMGEDRGGHICFTEFYRRNFFMDAKGRVKDDRAFKFYEQESVGRGISYHARRTTYNARPTTHDPRPTTHDSRPTTHDARPTTQSITCTFPIMHLICLPKFCISIVFNLSWDGCNTREKWKTKVMQSLGEQIRCIMGNMQVAYQANYTNLTIRWATRK